MLDKAYPNLHFEIKLVEMTDHQKMLSDLMERKLWSVDAELEKDQFKCLEMRKLNDRKILILDKFFL